MNILIPDSWLRDYLKTDATPEEIARDLSLSGPSVERIIEVEGEPVYDIEVTANRVDAMSIYGIAREAGAILPEYGFEAKLEPLDTTELDFDRPLEIAIENDPKLCKRILTVKLENVNLADSPDWLKRRLLQVDQRPLNNAIDITNYVMWEIGHPVHVFDYDRLTEKKIVVRQAEAGEKLVTLDDKVHELKGGEVIFEDGKGTIIDLPGIMGTANTVVNNDTNNVLLWIESVDSRLIRQASMGLAIRSQAAVLNEKQVDPHLGKPAILRAVQLFKEIAGASIGSQLFDDFHPPEAPETTGFGDQEITRYLGIEIEPHRAKRMLSNLGCQVEIEQTDGRNFYRVTPPTYRSQDLKIAADYIEEIARIYGYHKLPSKVMETAIPIEAPTEDFALEYKIKTWLSGWGANEIYTYSMVSKDLAMTSGHNLEDHLELLNPLTDDGVYLKRSLIPSLAQVIGQNPGQELSVFELQNVYLARDNKDDEPQLPLEELHLSLVTNQTFGHLKGLLEALLIKLRVEDWKVSPQDWNRSLYLTGSSGRIMAGDLVLGTIGRLKENADLYGFDLSVKALTEVSRNHPRFTRMPSTPPVIEDLTFKLPEKTHLGPVMETIKSQSELIDAVALNDRYGQNYTFRISYRNPDKSLSTDELSGLRKQVVESVESEYDGELIGELTTG